MPQATKIKERKRYGRNSENNSGVESIALFDFGMDDSYTSIVVRDDTGKIKKAEKVVEKEQRGIDLLEEEPDHAEQGAAQAEINAGRKSDGRRKAESDAEQQGISADAEGVRSKGSEGTVGKAETRTQRTKKADSGTVEAAGQHEQKVQGRKGSRQEEIKFTGKRGDFSQSSVIWSPKTIEIGPKETSDELEVEVQIEGIVYKVSKWSVIGNTYHQGLDSRYLVNFYKG